MAVALLRWSVAGALLLCGPELILFAPRVPLGPLDSIIAMTLTPVVIAIGIRAGCEGSRAGMVLWPGIAAAAGLLLILPQPHLSRADADCLMALGPAVTGSGCVLFYRQDTDSWWWQATAALVGAAITFALGRCLVTQTPPEASSVAFDGVLAFLAIMALRRLEPLQYAARFALVPFLVLLEALIISRPALTWRWLGGLILLAAATLFLLRKPGSEDPLSLVP